MYKILGNRDYNWCDIITKNNKNITIFKFFSFMEGTEPATRYNFKVEFATVTEVKKYILLNFSDYRDLGKLFELLDKESDV